MVSQVICLVPKLKRGSDLCKEKFRFFKMKCSRDTTSELTLGSNGSVLKTVFRKQNFSPFFAEAQPGIHFWGAFFPFFDKIHFFFFLFRVYALLVEEKVFFFSAINMNEAFFSVQRNVD